MLSNLPTEMLNTFYDLTRRDGGSFDQQLRSEVQAIERKASAAGMLGSGNTIYSVCRAGADSLSDRCRAAWAQLFRGMSAYGIKIDRETGSLFLSELVSQAAHSMMAVRVIVGAAGVFRSISGNGNRAGMDILEKALEDEIARMKVEVSLLVAESENLSPMSVPPLIQIFGDANNVVAGNGNQVNTHTQIDTTTAKSIADALSAILAQLAALPPDAPADVTGIREKVEVALAEVQKQKPNPLTVTSAIKVVAETIRFVPALKAAYDTIKPAAAMAGIYLP